MARLFQDGFELGRPTGRPANDSITGLGWLARRSGAANGITGVTTNDVRSGVYCVAMKNDLWGNNPNALGQILDAPLTEHYGRVYYRYNHAQGTEFVGLGDSSNNQLISFRKNSDHDFLVFVDGVQVASVAAGLTMNVYQCVEWRVVISGEIGLVETRLDGNSVVLWEGDTDVGDSGVQYFWIGSRFTNIGSTSLTHRFDDVAINDTVDDGTENNSWCGPGEIILLKPKANGDVNEWTRSNDTVNHWELVNEVPGDGDDTYNYSDEFDEIDTYKTEELQADLLLEPVAGVSNVKAVQLCFTGRWEGAGADILPFLRSGAANQNGDKKAVSSAYDRLQQDTFSRSPFTSQAWTFADVDALQVGVQHKERV